MTSENGTRDALEALYGDDGIVFLCIDDGKYYNRYRDTKDLTKLVLTIEKALIGVDNDTK